MEALSLFAQNNPHASSATKAPDVVIRVNTPRDSPVELAERVVGLLGLGCFYYT